MSEVHPTRSSYYYNIYYYYIYYYCCCYHYNYYLVDRSIDRQKDRLTDLLVHITGASWKVRQFSLVGFFDRKEVREMWWEDALSSVSASAANSLPPDIPLRRYINRSMVRSIGQVMIDVNSCLLIAEMDGRTDQRPFTNLHPFTIILPFGIRIPRKGQRSPEVMYS